MDDRFINEENNRKKRPSYTKEPQYENEPSFSENDSIFSDRSVHPNTNPRNAKFTVNIPDTEPDFKPNPSAQSRIPKGKPVEAPHTSSSYYKRDVSGRPIDPSFEPHPYSGTNQTQRSFEQIPVRQTVSSGSQTPPVSPSKKRKKKKSNGKKIAVSVLCIFLVLLLALFGYGYSVLGKINYDTGKHEKNKYISASELNSSASVQNILFIGSDSRSEIQGMRSDTMMLFSIDKTNKKIKLTSFLRDSYVCIPSTGKYRKLNAACSMGKQQLVLDTIEYNFKVKIDNYILVDFEAFTKFIDALGGLEIDGVTKKEVDYLKKNVKGINIKEGKNRLTGGATLWYSRIRYLDNDFYRTERQRKVISALVKQITKTDPVTLMKAVNLILPMITTDIERNDFIKLGAGAVTSYLRYDIVQHQIPANGTWSNRRIWPEGDVLYMDISKNAKLLKDFLYSKESKSK